MRIVRCSVQNFGTLSGFDCELNDGLTVIKQDNGFGKSTLAVFVKAMFYGLPQSAKRNLDENERKKYTPWQGGSFGGSLVFEKDDRQYRIERSFAAKEKDDTFKLYDFSLNSESLEYSSNIGFELFGIDAESFERSIYLPQSFAAVSINTSLRAKLTDLVENSDDMSGCDKAIEKINKKQKELSYQNGAKGEIANKKAELELLSQKYSDALAAEKNHRILSDEIKRLQAETEELSHVGAALDKKITAASDAAAIEQIEKTRSEYSDEVNKRREALSSLKAGYPNGFSTDEERAAVLAKIRELSTLESEMNALAIDTADEERLYELERQFADGTPTDAEISAKRRELSNAAQNAARQKEIEKMLDGGETEKRRGAAPTVIVCLSAALAVAGGVTCVFRLAIGVIILAIAVLGLGASAFLHLKIMISATNHTDKSALRREYNGICSETEALLQSVGEFLSKYRADGEPDKALDKISKDVFELERLRLAHTERNKELDARHNRATVLEKEIKAFFAGYLLSDTDGYEVGMRALERDCEHFERLESELQSYTEKLGQLPPKAEVPVTGLDRDALLTEKETVVSKLEAKRKMLSEKTAAAGALSDKVEQINEYEDKIESAKAELCEMTEQLEVYKNAAELLEKAKSALSGKYLKPMTDGFKKYSEILNIPIDGFMIDEKLDITLETVGAGRVRESFSLGTRDMIDIAMRLSLGEALFGGRPPVLILDDPFVNLDDVRVKEALCLLEKLSENRQIVYLTCHSSRTL